MMYEFYGNLLNLLKQDERFFSKEGIFLRNAAYEAAMKLDTNLLKILLSDKEIEKYFFEEVEGVKVFDKIKFSWVINNREFLPDSFTRFKNKIGLVDERGEFISQSGKIELVFPYKDCVLEGGQTKDEQKRAEIFYNETLAPNEIDRLLEPKVFTGAKRYSAEGVEDVVEFSTTDNLIIKGNNLLAVASIIKRFEKQVKCIYIDVPYNTGNDSFGYNDRFNHSTWLTFMKNRLELAKKLLRNDGSIFVHCDNNEQAYLKILMDEIFDRDNFINDIIWKRRGGSANPSNRLDNVTDYILWYRKSSQMSLNVVFSKDDENTQKYIKERFKYTDENGRIYMKSPIQSPNLRPNLIYDYKGYRVPAKGWSISKDVMEKWDAEGRLAFPDDKSKTINRKIFLDEYQGQPISNLWTDIFVINPMSGERVNFDGQKPEALIARIFELSTVEGELVLDYHLGSGTTAAVAHKMKRRYIGIEQMDYIQSVTVERLKKVIDGEQGGISRAVDWNGGGSFIYCELKKLNQNFVEEIETTQDFEKIWAIYKKMENSGFISYKINPADIDAAADDFEKLSLDNQKKFLMELLDKNLLYVNYREIDDEEFEVSDADKIFTRSFYKED